MAYAASQNPKTDTTYTAAALFATLVLVAGIAALAMHPAEAFAKPLCAENGPCYAGVNTNASAADGARSLCNSMACMRSAIEGKLCAKRCLSGNGAAFVDENGNGICDNYETRPFQTQSTKRPGFCASRSTNAKTSRRQPARKTSRSKAGSKHTMTTCSASKTIRPKPKSALSAYLKPWTRSAIRRKRRSTWRSSKAIRLLKFPK